MDKNLKTLRKIVQSTYLDLFAVALILLVSILQDFQGTFYFNHKVQFEVAAKDWLVLIGEGAFPLGLFSIVVACFSMLSTRFIAKQNNLGNFIGIFTTICVCLIDFLLGNKSAVITYPLTFLISIFGTYKWRRGERIRQIDLRYYLLVIAGLIVGYALVYVGFEIFGTEGEWYSDTRSRLLFHAIALTFGLSIGANMAVAFKYEETWLSWFVYNLVQLMKSVFIMNWATVGKYLFYILNTILTWLDWKFNKDIEPRMSQKASLR